MKNKLILLIIIGLISLGGWYLTANKNVNIPLTSNTNQENQTSNSSPSAQVTTNECSGVPTPSQTEGPYYKVGSPERVNISQGVTGEPLAITGFVFDKNCKPVSNAWLDFWQADANGEYDNNGYTLRGHVLADDVGKYTIKQ